ncbi:MAG: helix-turn-helix domain-containing protein [Kiritimatiellae bacterium]|nr:helix-turn-helix domain-containing protein [Kiritimatiellia bacterium]
MASRRRESFFHARDFFPKTGMALYVTRTAAHPDTRVHAHDFTELVVIRGGSGTHHADGDVYPLGAGDVFVIARGTRHGYGDTAGLSLMNILFDARKLGIPRADIRQLPGYHALFALEPKLRRRHRFRSRLRLRPDQLAHVETLVGRLLDELAKRRPGYRFAATALLMELIAFLSRCYSRMRQPETQGLLRIGELLSHCESHYDEPITLDGLAARARTSKSTLLRRFHTVLSMTPMAYVIRLRIRKASELLRESDLNVTQIALRTGFSDSNYFSRQFRKIAGSSPRAYRRQSRRPPGREQET